MEDWLKYVETREPNQLFEIATECLICGEAVPVYSIHSAPKICGSCKEAVMWAREKMKQGEK